MAREVEKLSDLNQNELENKQRDLAEQIFRLRFQLSTGQAEGLKKTPRGEAGSCASKNQNSRN